MKKGQTLKFAVPGSSNMICLNFSVDAIKEMEDSVKTRRQQQQLQQQIQNKEVGTRQHEPEEQPSSTTVDSGPAAGNPSRPSRRRGLRSGGRRRKIVPGVVGLRKKSAYSCQQCGKSYANQRLLDRHVSFHVEVNSSCAKCGKVFRKKWLLEQHMAVDHGGEEGGAAKAPLACAECGKTFGWERNLLAHMQMYHLEERRTRCKYCPLTFLKKKNYINHSRTKHPNMPETWCKVRA